MFNLERAMIIDWLFRRLPSVLAQAGAPSVLAPVSIPLHGHQRSLSPGLQQAGDSKHERNTNMPLFLDAEFQSSTSPGPFEYLTRCLLFYPSALCRLGDIVQVRKTLSRQLSDKSAFLQ